MDFKIDQEKCIQCHKCAADCPVLIIDAKTEYPEIKENKEGLCIRCQHCLAVCPTGALSIWGKNPEDSVPVNDNIPRPEALEQLIRTRRSIRRFRDEEIDKELIHRLLSTAAHAPTSQNNNTVLFTLVEDRKNLAELRSLTYEHIKKSKAEDRLPQRLAFMDKFQSMWYDKQIDILFRNAPHLLIASAPKQVSAPETDTCIALSYFELLANSHGIGTMWNGFALWAIDRISPEVRTKIGIPEDHVIGAVLVFGKPAVKYARSIQSDGLNIYKVKFS